ncbi:hypothetical protein M427DRAFT_27999 [Gonapodya prolifera JEL478]|uniref:Uncharacterized protein n=1 Tax=Gonapodya prolifera (strain JEL478) TaxID=1344416 RepID=A0A139AWI8_GONPJ|nr:hypothetical protein M427DRAFT_27999 [Gonapodya prolifera JEL478]|eukprot:KXS20943.1 hypothetical protein M427DRAFT_27999 [Gonapodya prolifera JEL478]
MPKQLRRSTSETVEVDRMVRWSSRTEKTLLFSIFKAVGDDKASEDSDWSLCGENDLLADDVSLFESDSTSAKTIVADENPFSVDQAKDRVEQSCWSSKAPPLNPLADSFIPLAQTSPPIPSKAPFVFNPLALEFIPVPILPKEVEVALPPAPSIPSPIPSPIPGEVLRPDVRSEATFSRS